jgi:hypothetical protein
MTTILACEQILILIGNAFILTRVSPDEFNLAIQRAEEGDLNADVEALQSEFCGNRMLKGIGQVRRRVEHATVIDVGHVDAHRVILGHRDLRGFHRDATFACDPAHGHFGHASKQRGRGLVGLDTLLGEADIVAIIEEASTIAARGQMARQFSTGKIREHTARRVLVHRQPLISSAGLLSALILDDVIDNLIGLGVDHVIVG